MTTSSEKIDSGIEVFEQDTSLQRSYGKEHGNTGANLGAEMQSEERRYPQDYFGTQSNTRHRRSHCRFLTWVAYYRNLSSDVTDNEKRTCPLIGCEQSFPTPEAMLRHVCDCPRLSRGVYRCYETRKKTQSGSCHTPGCQVLRQRFFVVINSLRLVKERLSRQASNSHQPSHKLPEKLATDTSISRSPVPWNSYSSESATMSDSIKSHPLDTFHYELETNANVPELFDQGQSYGNQEYNSGYLDYGTSQLSEMDDTSYFPMSQMESNLTDSNQHDHGLWACSDPLKALTRSSWPAQLNTCNLPSIDTNATHHLTHQTPGTASTNSDTMWDTSCFSPLPTSSTSDTSMSSAEGQTSAVQTYEESQTFFFNITRSSSMSDQVYLGEAVSTGDSSSSLTPIATPWPIQLDETTSSINPLVGSEPPLGPNTLYRGGFQMIPFQTPGDPSLPKSQEISAPQPLILNTNPAPKNIRNKFRCHGCGYEPNGCGAYYASNMKRHQETCPRYTGNSLLKRHTCPSPGCGKGYTRVDNLRVHQKNKGHILAEMS